MNPNSKEVSIKRSLISTFLLLGQMLWTSPKKNTGEEAFAQIPGSILDPEWNGHEYISPYLNELVQQGYLTKDMKLGYALTPFGQKMALQSIHNTPDFGRLADKGTSTCFAMLFAAVSGLKNHLKEQSRLTVGKDDTLVRNVQDTAEFFAAKLGMKLVPIEEVVAKTKKAKVIVTEEV